jgi:hypothetical protein
MRQADIIYIHGDRADELSYGMWIRAVWDNDIDDVSEKPTSSKQ